MKDNNYFSDVRVTSHLHSGVVFLVTHSRQAQKQCFSPLLSLVMMADMFALFYDYNVVLFCVNVRLFMFQRVFYNEALTG